MNPNQTKLQIALDDISLDDALSLLEQIHSYIDIIEVGTPFLMEYGMHTVRTLKNTYPDLQILCDAKIMDAGAYEARLAFDAGADIVTVLAVTDDLTIQDCIEEARKAGKKLMADLICVSDIPQKVRRLDELGVDIIGIHTGVDQQAKGQTPLDDLKLVASAVTHAAVSVAGGIKAGTVSDYLAYHPDIVISGGGIVKAEDPVKAAAELHQKIKEAASK